MDWQPIETAPRDGTRLLVTETVDEIDPLDPHWPTAVAWWSEDSWGVGAWRITDGCSCFVTPTHWMFLQQPPKVSKNLTALSNASGENSQPVENKEGDGGLEPPTR